ncbi:MAG TPA: galactose oxidase-like domain-containing protein [Blastocatellia bacterium]|nr:galactose oxidase-like domain-containing protein [Blastocatellia bacterium]
MPNEETPENEPHINAKTHRRLLRYINLARSPEAIALAPKNEIPPEEPDPLVRRPHFEHELEKREKIIEIGQAREILEARDRINPLQGFANIGQLRDVLGGLEVGGFLDDLIACMGPSVFGEWIDIGPIQTEDGEEFDVIHAAMLRTGWVMFIENGCGKPVARTPLWNPFNRDEVELRVPAPPTDNLYCSGHSFLSDGRLLVVGGGGDLGETPNPNFGWLFDPVDGPDGTWSFTKDNTNTRTFLNFERWYPTLVTLGDVPGRVLIASGRNPRMEIYEEATGKFSLVTTPADRAFNPLYPGLHLLPGGEIFFAPVGFSSGGSFPNDDPSNEPAGYFEFDNTDNLKGEWTDLDPNDRTKGMSVLLLSPTFPYAQVLIVGGGNLNKSRTYQMINLSHLSPVWEPARSLPMAPGQLQPTSRVNVNPVLLPDGTVFVSGGAPAGEPCWIFNPATSAWSEMDEAPRERKYHSHALLLPTAEVMSCGWQNNNIEVFRPPYLFRGDRPVIDEVHDHVHLGEEFEICTEQAYEINKVVLVRPMAPTHNTDTEQRVVQLLFYYAGENVLRATAPNGWLPHATAPRGYYMLFIINYNGVPSVAKFIRLE